MCKLAFTWYNSPSAHTLKRYVFQSHSSRIYIGSYHTKSSTLRARGFDLHMTPRCTERCLAAMSYDTAWNLPGCGLMVLAASSEPCTHSLLLGKSTVYKVTATHPFQANPCHCLEGNVSLLLHLCSLPPSIRQEVSWTLLFWHSNTSCCIDQSPHVPLWVKRFNSPVLTSSLASSLTGYAASSHFIGRSWVKASGRWWV